MPKGIILKISSDRYEVKVKNEVYNCLARGKWKKEQEKLMKKIM